MIIVIEKDSFKALSLNNLNNKLEETIQTIYASNNLVSEGTLQDSYWRRYASYRVQSCGWILPKPSIPVNVQLIVEWLWISANIKVVPRYPWWEDEFPIGVMEGIHFQIPQINLF